MGVNEWHKSVISEKLSNTVDFRDETVRRIGPEPPWMGSRRVFESFSEIMDSSAPVTKCDRMLAIGGCEFEWAGGKAVEAPAQ